MHQLSRILARELVSQHINVNVIAPGRFPSKMTQHIGHDEQALAQDTALIPMKRWGREEEMAALAISLASTAGAYMTGNIIPLDGGFSL
ncbi:Rhamnolipids biosynthesis 3-oxoacyl-[acyl-carrier-protein] reductase [compost metagenome]